MIAFTVHGVARPAGSKRGFVPLDKNKNPYRRANGGVAVQIVDSNPNVKEWQAAVRSAAHEAFRGDVLRGPIRLTLTFYRLRPKGHYSTAKATKGHIKPGVDPFPLAKPDVLKLARGVEDALTGVVWADDAQIVDERLGKEWGATARCDVVIEPMDEAERQRVERILTEKPPF